MRHSTTRISTIVRLSLPRDPRPRLDSARRPVSTLCSSSSTTAILTPHLQQRHYAWGNSTPDEETETDSTAPKRYQLEDYSLEAIVERAAANSRTANLADEGSRARTRRAPRRITEDEEDLEWLAAKEREKIISTAARLRLKKEMTVVRMGGFVRSLLDMPEFKDDKRAQGKVAEALNKLNQEGKHIDLLLEQLSDLLEVPYPELMQWTENYADEKI